MNTRILLVMPPSRRMKLLAILKQSEMEVAVADSYREAEEKLRQPLPYDLLFVDAELPGGSWKALLKSVLESKRLCEFVVCSRCGDERLWAEVIQCGAYDLIPEPYERQEVGRIAQNALESQYHRLFTDMRPPSPGVVAS